MEGRAHGQITGRLILALLNRIRIESGEARLGTQKGKSSDEHARRKSAE